MVSLTSYFTSISVSVNCIALIRSWENLESTYQGDPLRVPTIGDRCISREAPSKRIPQILCINTAYGRGLLTRFQCVKSTDGSATHRDHMESLRIVGYERIEPTINRCPRKSEENHGRTLPK